MKSKITLLVGTLLLPMLSIADTAESKSISISNLTKLESMDIKTLIEKAKIASSQDRTEIENLIKKKISKAHRELYVNG